MKRFHVNMSVADLDKSIQFYSTLFAQEPTVVKDDYAKWMLEDPRVNFSINNRGIASGINHLGLQAETSDEFSDIGVRLKNADAQVFDEGAAVCCYAKSDKAWIRDPDGIAWETFLTHGDSTTYGEDPKHEMDSKSENPCCEPPVSDEVVDTRPHGNCC